MTYKDKASYGSWPPSNEWVNNCFSQTTAKNTHVWRWWVIRIVQNTHMDCGCECPHDLVSNAHINRGCEWPHCGPPHMGDHTWCGMRMPTWTLIHGARHLWTSGWAIPTCVMCDCNCTRETITFTHYRFVKEPLIYEACHIWSSERAIPACVMHDCNCTRETITFTHYRFIKEPLIPLLTWDVYSRHT